MLFAAIQRTRTTMSGHRPLTRVLVLLLLACACIGPVAAAGTSAPDTTNPRPATAADSWPGWRGLAAEGRSAAPLPVKWDAERGFAWKVALPGRGHSSPVVAGDHVYVTTAYLSAEGRVMEAGLRYLLLVLTMVLAAAGIRVVSKWLRGMPSLNPGDLVAALAVQTSIVVLTVIALSGETLFDFARCGIRGWIGSAFFATVCMAVATARLQRRRTRVVSAALLFGFAALILDLVPTKTHAYKNAMNTVVMLATATGPALVGAALAWSTIPSRRLRQGGFVAGAVIATLAAAGCVAKMTNVAPESVPETDLLRPLLGGWAWICPAAGLAAGATWWLLRPASLAARVMLVIVGAASAVITSFVVLEQAALRTPYLAYQLGTPEFAPWHGPALLASAFALVLADALLVLRRQRHPTASSSARWEMPALRAAAAAMAVVFFVLINVVPAQQVTVRAVVAVDRDSGETAWIAEGLPGPQELIDGRNSAATPTPVTDGTRVCAYFGNHGVMCADTGGRILWSRTDVGYDSYYGVGHSPVLGDGLLVLAGERPDGLTRVRALDAASGTLVWSREFVGKKSASGNNRTPIIKAVGGSSALIVWGIDGLRALRLATGDELWLHPRDGMDDLVSSPVSDGDLVFLSDRTGTVAIDVIRATRGDDPVVWQSKARSNCVSPVICRGLLFTVTDGGIATTLRTATGETVWRHRLQGDYFASLLASPDAVYYTNNEGLTTVLACDEAVREVATNDLGEATLASMAAAGGRLFIRTAATLYAVQ